MTISFTVPGRPTRWMRPGQGTDGEGEPFRFNDKKAESAKRALTWEAKRAFGLRRPALGPVVLGLRFVFAIPPSWSKARRQAALEGRVWHTSDPDIDRLINLVMDALVGIAYVDDNQVVGFIDQPAKRYGHPERTEITVRALPVTDAEKGPGQLRLEKRLAEVGWDVLLAPPAKHVKRSKTERQEAEQAAAVAAIRAGGSPKRTRARWRRGRG